MNLFSFVPSPFITATEIREEELLAEWTRDAKHVRIGMREDKRQIFRG